MARSYQTSEERIRLRKQADKQRAWEKDELRKGTRKWVRTQNGMKLIRTDK